MLYPVGTTNPVQVALSAQLPSDVINNGPGRLFVYGGSSVSALNYSMVLNPNGTLHWEKGELWAISDSATVVNVITRTDLVNVGRIGIAGTVKTKAKS